MIASKLRSLKNSYSQSDHKHGFIKLRLISKVYEQNSRFFMCFFFMYSVSNY
jgi:hypothetical protein